MPLIIPKNLPAYSSLQNENVFVMHKARAMNQQIRPLKILIVNLMPTKIATETQLARVLANSPLQVQLTLLRMDSHVAKNTTEEHMKAFYTTFDKVKNNRYDGMIITGAPVETLPFEQVDYWKELCDLFEFSKTNVYSTVHICWGAQAGLYYHYGIEKKPLEKKLSGVFAHTVTRPQNPLVRGFDEVFYAPHSRLTYVDKADVEKVSALRVLAESDKAGLHILSTDNGRQIFIFGHMEYDRDTLKNEYLRDLKAGLNPEIPENYFENDDPDGKIIFNWRSHANLLFSNWLNYYVYQETPYDLRELRQEIEK